MLAVLLNSRSIVSTMLSVVGTLCLPHLPGLLILQLGVKLVSSSDVWDVEAVPPEVARGGAEAWLQHGQFMFTHNYLIKLPLVHL